MGSLLLVLLHLGPLHSDEKWLVPLIAFGPFLVLFAVVYYARRRDIAEDEAATGEPSSSPSGPPES